MAATLGWRRFSVFGTVEASDSSVNLSFIVVGRGSCVICGDGTMDRTLNKADSQDAAQFSASSLDVKALSMAIAIGAVAGTLAFFWLDPLLANFGTIKLPGDLTKAIYLMELFGHGIGVLLIVWLLAMLGEQRWRQVAAAVVLTSAVGAILKMAFVRQRPSAWESEDIPGIAVGWLEKSHVTVADSGAGLIHDSLHSFPSGHATTAFALAAALALLYPRGRAVFFTVAAMVAVQRVFAKAHFFSDVIVGATIGFVLCRLIMAAMETRQFGMTSHTHSLEVDTVQRSLPGESRAA